jgi:putative endonuclease
MDEKQFYVYILTNKYNKVLYTGVTGNLPRRTYQHKEKMIEGFTKNYCVTKLVYYELCRNASNAIAREKQIKGGSRKKKIDLIMNLNPEWNDLYDEIASRRPPLTPPPRGGEPPLAMTKL